MVVVLSVDGVEDFHPEGDIEVVTEAEVGDSLHTRVYIWRENWKVYHGALGLGDGFIIKGVDYLGLWE